MATLGDMADQFAQTHGVGTTHDLTAVAAEPIQFDAWGRTWKLRQPGPAMYTALQQRVRVRRLQTYDAYLADAETSARPSLTEQIATKQTLISAEVTPDELETFIRSLDGSRYVFYLSVRDAQPEVTEEWVADRVDEECAKMLTALIQAQTRPAGETEASPFPLTGEGSTPT